MNGWLGCGCPRNHTIHLQRLSDMVGLGGTKGINIAILVYLFIWGGACVCLLSSVHLFRNRYVNYLKASWWTFSMRFLMLGFGMVSLLCFSIECSRMAPLTPAVMAMRGFPSNPLFVVC